MKWVNQLVRKKNEKRTRKSLVILLCTQKLYTQNVIFKRELNEIKYSRMDQVKINFARCLILCPK